MPSSVARRAAASNGRPTMADSGSTTVLMPNTSAPERGSDTKVCRSTRSHTIAPALSTVIAGFSAVRPWPVGWNSAGSSITDQFSRA